MISQIRFLVLLKKADGVKEDDEDGHRRDVAHKCLPSKINGGVGNLEFGFGAFGRHEPAGRSNYLARGAARSAHAPQGNEANATECGPA